MKSIFRIGLIILGALATITPASPAPQTAAGQAPVFRPGVIGFPMPDFSLPAIQGGAFSPSALKGKNVLLIFPRGKVDDTWCWICHYQYAELADLEARLQLRKTFDLEILFVLPYGEAEVRHWTEIFQSQMKVIEGWINPPDFDKFPARRKEMVKRIRQSFSKASDFGKGPMPTPFPILYDKDQAVSKMLGLFTTNWDGSAVDQNIPTVYLLSPSGDVRFKYMSQITFDRPNAAFLIKILEKLILGR